MKKKIQKNQSRSYQSYKPRSQGISLKKQFGQHFLRDLDVVKTMLGAINSCGKNVFEIGCGDGFLTREIVKQKVARLWVFEIDQEWASFVAKECSGYPEVTVFHENFLDVADNRFEDGAPWILFSNLPYQVTFPILRKIYHNRSFVKEGVVMVQEEVAQKIVKKEGRGYGYISLFFQHYFEWELLIKISPAAFFPPPSVYSRLLRFKVKEAPLEIEQEERFWKFIKMCFLQPRRTLRNNIDTSLYSLEKISEQYLELRAQQMTMSDFLTVWGGLLLRG